MARKIRNVDDSWGKQQSQGSGGISNDWGSTAQRDEEEIRRKRAQQKVQNAQNAGWANKASLRAQTLADAAPTDKALSWADFYAQQTGAASRLGNNALANQGYQRYKAALANAEAEDKKREAIRGVQDVSDKFMGTFRSDAAQADKLYGRQTSRAQEDAERYARLMQSAALMRDQSTFQKAQEGYNAAVAGYDKAVEDYYAAHQKEMDQLQQTNKAQYYGETVNGRDLRDQVHALQTRAAIKEREIGARREQIAKAGDQRAYYQGGSDPYASDETLNRLNGELEQINEELTRYQYAQKYRQNEDRQNELAEKIRQLQARPDYQDVVKAGREIAVTSGREKAGDVRPSDEDFVDVNEGGYGYYNAMKRERSADRLSEYGADFDDSYMTDGQREIYYALFGQDRQAAQDYAQMIYEQGENERLAQLSEKAGRDTGTRLRALIEGTAANTFAGFNPFSEEGQYMTRTGQAMISGGAQGLKEKGLFNTGALAGEWNVLGGKGLADVYQLGSSMLQSSAVAIPTLLSGGVGAVGAAGTILLGSSAAASDYNESLQRGLTEEQAKVHALAAGTAEALFEYVSLDKLVNEDITRGFLRNFLTQGGVEASEEAFTTIANRVSDSALAALQGYDSSLEARRKELIAQGYESGTAERMAEQEWLTEMINDALGGFVSGGIMSSAPYITNPIYRAAGAVGEFNDFTRTLSGTGEQGVDSTKDLTKGRVGRLMRNVGETLSAEQIEAARKITGQESTETPAANEKQSKRQQKKQSTRDGAVYEQAVQSIEQQIEQRGVGAISEVYNETVQKHGEGAKEIAKEAIARSASRTMREAANMAELERSANSMAKDAAPEVFRIIQQAKDQRAYDLYRQSGNAEDAERLMQQRAGNQSHGGALNMEAVITRNGAEQKASITGLSKDGKGVVLSDGSTVTAKEFASKDFAADADTKDIVGFLLKSDMGPAAELAMQNYITQAQAGRATDGYRYVMDTALAFNQGRRGAISAEQAQQRSSLDAETVARFYKLGEEIRKSDTQKEQEAVDKLLANAKKGVTGRKGSVDMSQVNRKLSDAEEKNLEVATKLAEVLGVDVGIFVSGTNEKGQFVGENGRYQDGKIWIDINAGRNSVDDIGSGILACMSHELTHFIQDYAPKAYAELKQFVLRQLTEAKGSAWVDRQIQSKIRRSKGQQLSITAAEDEVVADACQNVLVDSKAIHDYAKRFPQSFSEVLEWIKDFFAKVKEALSSRPMSTEAQVMSQLEAKVRKAFGELWDKGVMEAAEVHEQIGSKNKTAQEGGEQFSLRDAQRIGFDKLINQFYGNKLMQSNPIYFGVNGRSVSLLFGSDAPLMMLSRDMRKSIRKNAGNSRSAHALPESFVRVLPKYIKKSVMGYTEDRNGVPSFTILAYDEKSMKLYAIGGELNATYEGQTVNIVHTIFEVSHPEEFLTKKDKHFVISYKERAQNILEEIGIQSPALQNILDSARIVAQQGQEVKPTGQNSDRDTEYLELAKVPKKNAAQLQEMVDEAAKRAGYDMELYHGSKKGGGFTVFKDWQYFTPNKAYAERYMERDNPGSLYHVYVKSERMFDTRRPECREIFEQMRAEYGLSEIQENGLPDWTDGYDISDFIEENGLDFDGVVLDEGGDLTEDGPVSRGVSYIIRNSEQVKSADPVTYDDSGNVIPLSERFNRKNEDIRYSEREYDLPSDMELMDQAAESLSEAGGEEYWKALLESVPELAGDKDSVKGRMQEIRDLSRKLRETEKKLEAARAEMKTTYRKLNTAGVSNVVKETMKFFVITDAKNNGIIKKATQVLIEGYQQALDAVDAGRTEDTLDITYNAAVKAAEILLTEGRHTENQGGKWSNVSAERYLGEDRQQLIDYMVAAVGADFALHRYRDAIPETAADRLVSRTKREMQKKLDAQRARNAELTQENAKLSGSNEWLEATAKAAKEQVGSLKVQMDYIKEKMADAAKLSSAERAKLRRQARSLNERLQKAREEARAWKQLAEQEGNLASLYGEKQAALIRKLEAQKEREQKILEGKLKPLAMQRMLKAVRENAKKEAEQHKDEVFERYKDRKQQGDLRRRIRNLSDEMKRRMTSPTDRAYVPASLYESMTKLADVLDDVLSPKPGTKAAAKYKAMMDAIHGLSREYSAVQDMDDPVYASEYDKEIQDAISDIERILERKDADWIDKLTGDTTKGFRELSTGELQRLYELLRDINYSMVGATAMLGHSRFKSIFDAMQSVVEQQNGMDSLNSLRGAKHWNRMRLLDNLSVMRAVEMMSGWDRKAALYQLMHNIEQGSDESWSWRMAYNKSMEPLKTGKNEKEYRNALTKKLDFWITDEDGLKVLMTKMQALQILMTAEREAHNDKLVHLQTGGAVIRDAIDLQNGKGAKAKSQTIKVTPELLKKIQEGLTDWDRAYMKGVREYFQTEGKRTNEITYRLKHRVLQTEDYYVPYQVDSNYLETKLTEQQAMNMWVKTPGSTNALKQKAKQPVIIDGMDTVMGQHVKEIGDYIGMAIPIRDFSKVYNGRLATGGDNPLPVKKTIDRTFGTKGQHLLTQAVIDVQGGSQHQNWSSGISNFLSKLQGAFVRSALLINPSVTIKQAASYIAAESVLSHRALVSGNRALFAKTDKTKSPTLIAYLFANPEGETARRIYEEIDKHTSLHYQRRQGMSQAEIANEANRNGPVKRKMNEIGAGMEQSKIGHAVRKAGESLNPVTWIQRMDVATTATLWVACKEQARLDGMETGTTEFWQRTTEFYERCLRETQPMYDGLHRTAHQKQAGGLVQFLFPFRTVPIQNHGQLAASYEALKASKNKSKAEQAAAKKFFAKTVWAQTESAAIFSLMTFIAAALKRKTKKYRDEDEEFTARSFAKGFMTDVGSTLFSVLQPMYGSELVSMGSRALDKLEGSSGYTYDAFSVGVVDMLNDLASSSDKLFADTGKLMRGEDVSFADFRDHALALLTKGAKLAGIPADTVKTYAEGLIGNVQDAIEGRMPALNDESWERAAAVNANRYMKAWIAGDLEKVDRVEAEMLSGYAEDGKSEEDANKALKTKLTSTAKDAWKDGTLDKQDIVDFLAETGFYSADEAWKKVMEWENKAEHEGEEEYAYSQYEDLREALDAGEALSEAGADYLAHGYSEKQITDAAVDHLKDRYLAGEISEDEAIKTWMKYKGKDQNEAWMAIQRWEANAAHAGEDDYSFSQYDEIDAAIDSREDIRGLVSELTAHGVDENSIEAHVQKYLKDQYLNGTVSSSALKNLLSMYCGIIGGEADNFVRYADFQKRFPDSKIQQQTVDKYYDQQNIYGKTLEDAKIPMETYVRYHEAASKAKDTDKDGDGKTDSGSKKDAIMQIIDGLSLTSAQKDALYYFNGYSAKTISDAPWHRH